MGLLQPESGLVFWMLLSFAVVFVLVAKYGFPVILRAIDSRKEYIDSSLDAAKKAERKLEGIRAEGEALREAAEARQREILQDAAETRERIVQEAKRKADAEGQRIVAAAREQAATEREAILQDARRQVALLSVAISEKLLRGKLTDKAAQTQLAERLFDEFEQHQNRDKS